MKNKKEEAVPPAPGQTGVDGKKEELPVTGAAPPFQKAKEDAVAASTDSATGGEVKPPATAPVGEAAGAPEPTMKDIFECMKSMQTMVSEMHKQALAGAAPPTPEKEAEEEKPPELPKPPVTEAVDKDGEKPKEAVEEEPKPKEKLRAKNSAPAEPVEEGDKAAPDFVKEGIREWLSGRKTRRN